MPQNTLVTDSSPFTGSQEKLVFGRRTQEWIKARRPELTERKFSYVGITRARTPYRVVRPRFDEGHLIVTVGGKGEIWFAGEWRRCLPGDVYISPPGSPEAFRAIAGKEWLFCWAHTLPGLFDTQKLRIFQTDPRPFHLALEGYLNHETSNSPSGTLDLWAELLSLHTRHLMQSGKESPRLWKVWEAVMKEPGRNWDVSHLGNIANLSREQLRYHSIRETGRPPMGQVAYLRVQRALIFLQTTDFTLESISELVGYGNPFALSNTILKLTGKRPSTYRHREGYPHFSVSGF